MKIGANEDRYKMIFKKKRDTRPIELCHGLHENICEFIDYCRKLEFSEDPNYDYLIKLLYDAMEHFQFKVDFDYEWSKDINKIYSTNSNKSADLDNSMNISNIKNKNSNSGYSSLINKNEISQDLKMILMDDKNSINEDIEKEKKKESVPNKNLSTTPKKKNNTSVIKSESPVKQNYKTAKVTVNENELIQNKTRSNSNSQKNKKDTNLSIKKESENKDEKEAKEAEKLKNQNFDTAKKKEEDNSLCLFI